MVRLTNEFLSGIGPRVFGQRVTTLSEVGRDVPLADVRETVEATRADLRAALVELPEQAFAAQAAGAGEGEEVWSAGQVISHVSNSFHAMSSAVRSLLGMEPGPEYDALDVEQPIDRAEALAVLDRLDTATQAFFDAIPADADFTKTMTHPRFGEIDTNGWMILLALHENNHLNQVRALGATG